MVITSVKSNVLCKSYISSIRECQYEDYVLQVWGFDYLFIMDFPDIIMKRLNIYCHMSVLVE